MRPLPRAYNRSVSFTPAPLAEDEMVLCLDENTNLQPRPRLSPTLAAGIDQPVRLEHEYKRWAH